MPIIRRKLDPNTVYPEDIRYDPDTDTVQRKVNGTWVDAPESDPRTHTTFPPRITSGPACDGAESVKDALKGQIDSIITAIANASTAFTIAGIILGLFSFGVFAIFISIALTIADAMIGAGASALTAALTEPVYEQFRCILYCHMDTSGRLNPGSLSTVQSEVSSEIGGLAAVTLNAMLSLAGEGGINNLASLGVSTGDCGDCDCGDTCGVPVTTGLYTFAGNDDNWELNFGIWTGSQINGVPAVDPDRNIGLTFCSSEAFTFNAMGMEDQNAIGGTAFVCLNVALYDAADDLIASHDFFPCSAQGGYSWFPETWIPPGGIPDVRRVYLNVVYGGVDPSLYSLRNIQIDVTV